MENGVMRIEATQRGSRKYYEEVVCATVQYSKLIKNPGSKLGDVFKRNKVYLVLCAIFLAVIVAMAIAWGIDALTVLAIVVMLACIVLAAIMLHRMNGMVESLMADSALPVFIFDKEGIEFKKEGSQPTGNLQSTGDVQQSGSQPSNGSALIRVPWDGVAFVRIFDESICFFAQGARGLVLALNRSYSQQILDYLRENAISVNVIAD